MFGVSIALGCILTVLWILWRWKHLSIFSSAGIPGPKPNFFFGNIIELYRKGPLKCHKEWVKKYGRVFGYYYGMKPVLLVADPQLLKNIFIKDFSKFTDREPFSPIKDPEITNEIENTVLLLKGQKWKEVRSVLTPTFSAAKLKQMAVTMNSSIDVMLDNMKEKAKTGEKFNILDTYQRLTMDVITRTAFGIQVDVQSNPNSKLLHAAQLLFYTPYRDFTMFVGLCLPWLGGLCMRFQELILTIRNTGLSPIEMLRTGLRQVLDYRRQNPKMKKADLLQLMIDAKMSATSDVDFKKLEVGTPEETELEKVEEDSSSKKVKGMTDLEIVASSVTVFLAGYETTSAALGYTTYLLAKHQDIQDKVFEEIYGLVQKGEKLEYGTINKLPYLNNVLNESLRIYPPVYLFTNRYALEDVQYGSLKIPKGVIIQAPTHLLHHDPEYWSDPEKFDPDRFNTKPNMDGITYLPFGIGPRNCLGMRFAQMEAKLALAHTIYNYKVYLAEEDELPITLRIRTMAPSKGIIVKLECRSKETSL